MRWIGWVGAAMLLSVHLGCGGGTDPSMPDEISDQPAAANEEQSNSPKLDANKFQNAIKEKKGGFVLVTCLEDRQIRIKHLEKAIGAKRLSFGSAELLGETLGVIPGAVTPFSLFNDREARQVRMIVDAQMMAMTPQNFHPLHNEATIAVTPDGLRAFFAATGHEAEEVDFDALEALSAAD